MLNRRNFLAASLAAIPGRLLGATKQATESSPLTADVVVYGATPGGITAAVEAASHGLKSIIVGGWRETHLGGMMSGGLSRTDYLDSDAFGGRARDFLMRIGKLRGEVSEASDTGLSHFIEESGRRVTGVKSLAMELGLSSRRRHVFEPRQAELVFDQMVKEGGVPVYWTRGVDKVERNGTRISLFSTTDGQLFRGKVFIDASYEGDLLARAGVTYEVGRGPADDQNQLDGFRGLSREGVEISNSQFYSGAAELDIDPFVEHGNPASGLLPHVREYPEVPIGAADKAVQAYNFRLCLSNNPRRRLEFPSSPPRDYQKSNYEVLFRYLAAAKIASAPLQFSDLVKLDHIGGDIYDVNAKRAFSTDALGLNWEYPEASYEQREEIWKAHENYIRGFFYALAHEDDRRVPDSLRLEARSWGLARDQFRDPHPNDVPGWPYQLYVREARRMDGDIRWTAADLNRLDGFSARSTKIIALASYWQDSHQMQRLAYQDRDRGIWRLWNEGGLASESGGHDLRSPLPFEIILPKRQDCTNLLVTFCVSASHQAFSAIRMELCSMALGQAAGAAARIACAAVTQPDLQDLDYEALRDLLLRGDQMLDEKVPPYWSLQLGGGIAILGALGWSAVKLRKRYAFSSNRKSA